MPHTVSPAPSGVTALIEDTVHYVTSHLPVTPDCPPPRFSENFPLFNAAHRDLSATLSGPWKEATSAIDAALAGDAGVAWQDGLRRAGDSGESLRRDADEASRVCTHMTTTVMNGALELSRITNDYLNKATPLVNVIMTMAIAKGPLPQAPEQNPLAALHHLSSDARQHADATIHRINADLEQDVTALQKLLDHPAPSYPHCDIDIPPNPPTPTAPATAVPVPTVATTAMPAPLPTDSTGGGSPSLGAPAPSPTPPPPPTVVPVVTPPPRAPGATTSGASPQAQRAVEAALSALGTPYQWGGNTPGVGLDCSGLTHWAYAQAGVDIPRLAEAQTVGTPVNQDGLLPGDLVVWDGHVAMYIGDGNMVEAGDPVQISPLRTTNMGMNFLGFYRPTG